MFFKRNKFFTKKQHYFNVKKILTKSYSVTFNRAWAVTETSA